MIVEGDFMLQMLKVFSTQGRLLEIFLHGKKEEMLNGYAVDFHWDDMDDYVTFFNTGNFVANNFLVELAIHTIAKIGHYKVVCMKSTDRMGPPFNPN